MYQFLRTLFFSEELNLLPYLMNSGLRTSYHQVGLEPKIGVFGSSPNPPANSPMVIARSGMIFENLSQVLKTLRPNDLIDYIFSDFKFFKVHLWALLG